MGELLTVYEIAETVKISPHAVYKEINRGHLKALKVCSQWRVRIEDYDAWLERAVVNPPDQANTLERPRKLKKVAVGGLREEL